LQENIRRLSLFFTLVSGISFGADAKWRLLSEELPMRLRFPLISLLLLPAIASASLAASPVYQPPAAHEDGWAVGDARGKGWNLDRFVDLENAIAKGEFPAVTSVLVAKDGELVYERYFNDGSPETLNDVRSASKSATALLVGAAIDRGLIQNAQAKVYRYFPDEQPWRHLDPRKQDLTLEDLLTMSSLWECDDENQFSTGNEERMYLSENWTRFALNLPIKGFAPWMKRPEESPHGRAFSYCTAGTFVLGAVLERATGKPLSEFSAEVLEQPLGIVRSQWNRSSEGVGMGGGGTRYRSRDLAKLGQIAADGGRWQGRQIISERWIKATLSVHAQARDDAEYGYLFWRFRFPLHGREQGVWAMSGNGGNYVFVLPEENLVAVVTRTSYNQRGAHQQSQKIFSDYILKAMP
jgi:CubicO group peptidase (beta-lactamase class C family)